MESDAEVVLTCLSAFLHVALLLLLLFVFVCCVIDSVIGSFRLMTYNCVSVFCNRSEFYLFFNSMDHWLLDLFFSK